MAARKLFPIEPISFSSSWQSTETNEVLVRSVIPNLDSDEQWQQDARDMRQQFEDRLNKVYGMANAE